jgi:hypothetical protein
MTPEEILKEKLRELAKHIDDQLPENFGFVLLAFPFGTEGILEYIANCRRLDAVQVMREFIAMTNERIFGTNQDDKGKEGFEAWWKEQMHRHRLKAPVAAKLKELVYDAYVAGRNEANDGGNKQEA